MDTIEIGTVEVLYQRVYTLPDGTDAYVEPGVYPLLTEPGGGIWWAMRGRRSTYHPAETTPLTDTLSILHAPGDQPHGREIDVPSASFTLDEFCVFLETEPVVRDGDPQQRLRVTITPH